LEVYSEQNTLIADRSRGGKMDTNILLENGTNELEILEFTVGSNSYGINVAKIREIIPYQPVTPVPNSHPSIEGIFMPRDIMITAIDLKNCLGRGESSPSGLFILTNFNKLDLAFHVDSVFGIHRVSWRDIIKPDSTISTTDESVSTGIVKRDGKLIIILDFEKIVSDINPETGLKVSDINELGERKRSNVPILIAEDSPLLNKLIVDSLKKAGYDNLIHTENGQKAYNVICKCKADGTLHDHVRLIVTDIEMPEMDGHRLTKLVKGDEQTAGIPIIIFSSLVNDEMMRKGEALGADAQLSKPEIGNLVRIVDRLVDKYHLDQ
jgi:two-component system chemotaxis response regulator CheV